MNRALSGMLKALLPLVILAAAGYAAFTMIANRPPVETLTPVVEPPGVRVHEVTLQDAPLAVTSQGTVRPRTESQLVPEIAGRVTWVAPSFAEGGFFEAGDVLVRIDPFDYEQMLVSARSQLAQARLRLAQEEAEAEVAQREWDTLGRGDPRELALRKPQLDDARAAVAAAEASVERARRDLQRAEIVAPYAGRVRTKNVDIGQYVRVGDGLATVYAVDVAEVRLPLPDDELAYLDLPLSYRGVERQAQPRVLLRATFAGETHAWNGRIVRTESEIDSVSRMVHAVAEVADPYAPGRDTNRPPLAVGMYVEAEIAGRTARDVAVLPREALRGRDLVLVVTPDDRLSFRTVDVLRTSTESVIVRAGLQAGELVVTSPLDTPTDGMRVQLAEADPGLLDRRADPAAAEPEPAAPVEEMPAEATAAADADAAPESSQPSAAGGPGLPSPPAPAGSAPAAPEEAAATMASNAPAPAGISPADGEREAGRPPRPRWLAELLGEQRPAAEPPRAAPVRPAAPQRADRAPSTRSAPAARAAAEPRAEPIPPPAAPAAATAQAAAGGRAAGTPPHALAVLPFDDLSAGGGAALDVDLGSVITTAVAERLSALPAVAVVTPGAVADWAVGGGIQRIGSLVRVTARLTDVRSGAVVTAVKVDGTVEALADLQSRVAAVMIDSVREAIAGESVASAGPPAQRAAPRQEGRRS